MITLTDILIAIAFYYIFGIIASTLGLYIQYYAQISIKKLQIAYLSKHAPEVEDNRIKE